MYEIDFTCTDMNGVITRSYVCHSSMLCEALTKTAHIHADHALNTPNRLAQTIALKMEANLKQTVNAIRNGRFSPDSLSFGTRIQVFGVAAKLQCIPPNVQSDIAAREKGV